MVNVVIEEKDGYTVVEWMGNRLAYSDSGIVYNSDVERPVPGLMIIENRISKYDGNPEVEKVVHGIKHLLIGFDDRGDPVYAVRVGNVWYCTVDFKRYNDHYNRASPADIMKELDEEREREMYRYVYVDGKLVEGQVFRGEGYTVVYYPMTDGIVMVRLPFSAIAKRREYSAEDLLGFDHEWVVRFDDGVAAAVEKTFVNRLSIGYVFKNGAVIRYSPKRGLTYDSINVEPEDLRSIVRGARPPVKLGDVVEKMVVSVPEFSSKDVLEVIGELMSRAPYFGIDCAVPTKNQIITARGVISVKQLQSVPAEFERLAAWVLGMNDDVKINDFRGVHLILDGENSRGRVYRNVTWPVVKIGPHYYWYNKNVGAHVGAGGFKFHSSFRGVVKYSRRTLVLGENTIISGDALEKLMKGEKISIADVLPGFPAGGKIRKPAGSGASAVVEVGNKEFELFTEPYRLGLRVTIPYREGIFRVYIPFGSSTDVWSPQLVDGVPEELIIDDVLYIGFAREIPMDARVTYMDKKFRIEWGDNYIEVRNSRYSEVFNYLRASVDGREVRLFDEESVRVFLYADSIDSAYVIAEFL